MPGDRRSRPGARSRAARVVKGPRFWSRKSKSRTLSLYKFELKNLKVILGCEEATRAMVYYQRPYAARENRGLAVPDAGGAVAGGNDRGVLELS